MNGYFVTVDAETELALAGCREIMAIRDRLEREQSCKIPITWFVRFQRCWKDTVGYNRRQEFETELEDEFDGFRLLLPVLQLLQRRGDEIAWHYHAYHYVMRDDLPHRQRVENIDSDLRSCASSIRVRYPRLRLQTFRWGWFFAPDAGLQSTLKDLGFNIDASIWPGKCGANVANFNARYIEPVTETAGYVDGIYYYPYVNTLLVHDYEMVSHQLGWSSQGESAARARREAVNEEMLQLLLRSQAAGAKMSTYGEKSAADGRA